ncbi:recombination-associated protein RdgC [Spongiibacter sp. KMU-166]|uniref:Recombination-associated protein RdgC n=1 Tax=Spongiibacter thalassae TaxID=2721624 RepID=A0ABX1GDZ4_9GAMM|nr:recombination-associated protein RdgC [Spongiibacter thalassae]NKI17405.1 recombination-associated protein RdgC [Spongiibacter thalassae]
MMQFKRAVALTYPSMPPITEAALERLAFKPCGKQEQASSGFVTPHGFYDKLAGHSPDGSLTLLCLQTEEKLLPPAVVNRAVEDKVAQIKRSEDRIVGRKERQDIKEDIVFELLPRAFTTIRRTYAIIDHNAHLILVDGSAKAAEALTATLREALGSLAAEFITTPLAPSQAMTSWLKEGMPDQITVGDYCRLEEVMDGGAVQTCKNDDPQSTLIANAVDAGRLVVELGVSIGAIEFILTGALALRSIRFSDMALAVALEDVEDTHAEAQAALLLNASAIVGAFTAITNALGGLNQTALALEDATPAAPPPGLPAARVGGIAHEAHYEQALEYVMSSGKATISSIQRHCRIGYNRAAQIIEQLEANGVVSSLTESGTRQVLGGSQ